MPDDDKLTFCKYLDEMIADETKAPMDYAKLELLFSDEFFPQLPEQENEPAQLGVPIINSIIKDEQKHRDLLENMKRVFCMEPF